MSIIPHRLPFGFTSVLLVVLLLLVTLNRLCIPQQPFGTDVMAYAVIGHELLGGRQLYSDLWDHKPPAIYLTFALAEKIIGYTPTALILLNILPTLAAMLGIYFAGQAVYQRKSSGLWAAAFWGILSGKSLLEAREPNTEVFINACNIWAFVLLVQAKDKPLGILRAITVGLLFSISSLYKPVVVACCGLLTISYAVFIPSSVNRRKAFIGLLIIGLVGLATWCSVVGYFAATGRFVAFSEAVIVYNRYYSGDLLSNIFSPVKGELMPDFMNPIAVLMILGAILAFVRVRYLGILLVALIISSWLMIALPGQFYHHYYQFWLPPLCIGAGWFLSLVREFRWFRYKWATHILGAFLFIILALDEIPYYRVALSGEWTRVVDSHNIAVEPLAQQINTILAPGETLYLWGDEVGLYFWSRRRPPTGVFYLHHLLEGPLAGQLSKRVVSDLAREQPEILVVSERAIKKIDSSIFNSLLEHYSPLPDNFNTDTHKVLVRRGGKVEDRMGISDSRSRVQ